jgi:hypothetical protein
MNKNSNRHNNKSVQFYTNSETFVKLDSVIAQTGETKAKFFNRIIENEHAKLTGNLEKITSSEQYIINAQIDEMRIAINLLNSKMDAAHKQINANRDFIVKKNDLSISISMMVLKMTYKLFYFFLRFFVEKENITGEELKKRGEIVNRLSKETFIIKTNELRNSFNDGNLDVAEKYIQQEE